MQHRRSFEQPCWNGEDIGNRVLLIHAEQGFGDTLQFCRFVSLAAAGRRIVLEVQPSLVTLMKCLLGVEHVVARGQILPPFDLHCPLLSLPRILGITLATLPDAPYLTADATRSAMWRQRTDKLAGLKVGLAWAGNPAMAADRRRSLVLDQLAPLGLVPKVSFVSLQKGPSSAQAKDPPAGITLYDWTAELHEFADTAALIETLDLIIGVDTAIIHLAGALGKPVWLLNRFDCCWRWLIGRNDSPWYPSLRQFRQTAPCNWDSTFQALCRSLRHRAGDGDGLAKAGELLATRRDNRWSAYRHVPAVGRTPVAINDVGKRRTRSRDRYGGKYT